jgi:large subunit ribosomal protein L10
MKKKDKIILDLVSLLKENNSIYLVDILDLNNNQINNLRKELFKKNIKLKIVKNTLIKESFKKINKEKYFPIFPYLKGNTTLIISKKNNTPAKILIKFRKKINEKKPFLKGAYIDFIFYKDDKNLKYLAMLKSKEELIIMIIFCLKNTINKLIYSIIHPINNILLILKYISSKK